MRTVIQMNENWNFALHKGVEPMEKEAAVALGYRAVTLPHDWAVTSNRDRHVLQGEQQGYFDRWGIGWYRREFTLKEERPW